MAPETEIMGRMGLLHSQRMTSALSVSLFSGIGGQNPTVGEKG